MSIQSIPVHSSPFHILHAIREKEWYCPDTAIQLCLETRYVPNGLSHLDLKWVSASCIILKTDESDPSYLVFSSRRCLDTQKPGTDLSRLNAWQSEIFEGFRRKDLFKRSGSIQYLFRIAKRSRTVF